MAMRQIDKDRLIGLGVALVAKGQGVGKVLSRLIPLTLLVEDDTNFVMD